LQEKSASSLQQHLYTGVVVVQSQEFTCLVLNQILNQGLLIFCFLLCSLHLCKSTYSILALEKSCRKLNKAHLIAYLRSKILLWFDDNDEEIPKSNLTTTLVLYINMVIDGNVEFKGLRNHKTPNCYFRLLIVLFDDDFVELFQQTGAT
jgi:hypothetical protein